MRKITALFLTLFMVFLTFGCKNNGEEVPTDIVEKTNQTLKIHCYAYEDLNPLHNMDEANLQMLRLINESLFVCDETQKPKPVLAEIYSVSADGLVWTVKIKEGIKWHDGSEFTADDVVATYNDVLEYKDGCPYFAKLSHLELVEAVSDYKVNFKLISPQANFVTLLEVPIVKYHTGEVYKPVGTGPYEYKELKNKIIYLKSNENWHGGKVNITDVEVKVLPDKETSVYAYVSKETDIVSVKSTEDFDGYSSNSDNIIVDYPSDILTYIGINTSSEPLSNKLFRKSVAQGIDKEKICSEVLLSHGSVADSVVNSKWWFYNDQVTVYPYNKNVAQDTVKNLASKMKIVPIGLMVNEDNDNNCKTAEIIKDNLSECGITVYIEYTDSYTFAERVSTGNYHMFIGSIRYSPDVDLSYLIRNPDDKLQKLFDEFRVQTKTEGVRAKYYEIQEKIAFDLQVVPLHFDINSVMYNKRIEGELNPYRGNIYNGVENMLLTR